MQYDYYMEEEVKAFVAHSEEWKNNTPCFKDFEYYLKAFRLGYSIR